METVLVAGGAGYIGSHLCLALAGRGITPVTLDNLSTGHQDAVRWGPLVTANIADRQGVGAAIAAHKIRSCFHFAGLIAVGESVAEPARYYENNVSATIAFLQAALAAGIERVIFSSTAAVYGNPEIVPIPESHRTGPTSPYGHSKLMVEQILMDFAAAYGLSSVSLRYFNAAGADPGGALGERHAPETHLIPLVLEAAVGKRSDIAIYGSDYETPDGTCIRDYIHVADLCDAHILALRWLEQQPKGTAAAFNLGNGPGYSVLEVVETARRVTQRPIAARVAPPRAGDPAILIAASKQAQTILNWTPRFPALETQIAHAWQFLTQGPI